MVINMLKAISRILEDSKEQKVICAKVMLEEIIKGMEIPKEDITQVIKPKKEPIVQLIQPKPEPPVPLTSKPPKKPVPKDKRRLVVDHGKIVRIENYNGMLELDGKRVSSKDAIGMSFTNGRFIE